MTGCAIPAAALAQHIAVLGKTGSGKTYTVRGIVEGLLDQKARLCVIDPTGVWYGLRTLELIAGRGEIRASEDLFV